MKKRLYNHPVLFFFHISTNSPTTLGFLLEMTVPVLIPRKAIFGNPTRLEPRVSPDGQRIAFIAPKDDVLNIWVAPIGDPKNAKCITNDTKRGIRQYLWTHNNQIVYSQDKNGDEGMSCGLD